MAHEATGAHISSCGACAAAVQGHQVLRTAFERAESASESPHVTVCLDEAGIARIVDGLGSEAELAHVTSCRSCRAQVVAIAAALAAPELAAEIRAVEAPRRADTARRLMRSAGMAAAILFAVVFGVVATRLERNGEVTDTYRDTPVQAPVPVMISPSDIVVPQPIELRWRSAGDAREYRITVFNREGSVMWSDLTADTVAAVPTTVALEPGVEYWWRVEARVDFDRWTQSDIAPFRIRGSDTVASPRPADL